MRILVVEDEHRIANSIKKGLEQEAYAVDVAFDGEEGYDLAIGEEAAAKKYSYAGFDSYSQRTNNR